MQGPAASVFARDQGSCQGWRLRWKSTVAGLEFLLAFAEMQMSVCPRGETREALSQRPRIRLCARAGTDSTARLSEEGNACQDSFRSDAAHGHEEPIGRAASAPKAKRKKGEAPDLMY